MKRILVVTATGAMSGFMFIFGLGIMLGVFRVDVWAHNIMHARQRYEISQAIEKQECAFYQYNHADYASAKAALLEAIQANDQFSAKYGNPSPTTVDAMFGYVRLAKLEERNNMPNAQEYMREATSRCEHQLRWGAHCSATALREHIDQMDTRFYR